MAEDEVALIVGAGQGLSASLARLFAGEGMRVALAARNREKLAGLVQETGARAYACDAGRPADVEALFEAVTKDFGAPTLVVYNPSYRPPGRSEARRGGKECVSTCRIRGSPEN